jgi:hypothetical protein
MTHRYVALGSSMAAGPGILPRAKGAPWGSGRSARNYAHLVAERLNRPARLLPTIRELLDRDCREQAVGEVGDSLRAVGAVVRRRAPRARVVFVDYLNAAAGRATRTATDTSRRRPGPLCRWVPGGPHRGGRRGHRLPNRARRTSQPGPSCLVNGPVDGGCGVAAALAAGTVSPKRRRDARCRRTDRRSDR